jgi:hypothetical protein
MHGSAIDRLARTLAMASRRHALRMALGGAAAATTGMLAPGLGGDAKNRRKRKGKKTCGPAPCVARASGATCQTTLQCCPNETNRICAFANGLPGPICCGVLGATCATITDCCAGFACDTGRCVFAG